jgi:hypothetical protein
MSSTFTVGLAMLWVGVLFGYVLGVMKANNARDEQEAWLEQVRQLDRMPIHDLDEYRGETARELANASGRLGAAYDATRHAGN